MIFKDLISQVYRQPSFRQVMMWFKCEVPGAKCEVSSAKCQVSRDNLTRDNLKQDTDVVKSPRPEGWPSGLRRMS
jgi:hypothetical protein